MRTLRQLFCFAAPLTLVTAYRLVPDCIRGRYPGCSVSTSHLAVAGLWRGEGWSAVWRAIGDTKAPRPPMP